MIRAGRLRNPITYQSKTQTLDASGGPVDAWTTFATVRAEAIPLYGKDQLESLAAQSPADIKFRHRYTAGITSAMRIVFDSVNYEIIGQPVNIGMLNREHEVLARSVGGGA
jgi:SPP1 family predicted phage head-tail adaptor